MGRPPSLLTVDTGERFRALRKALGLSTAEVAKRTGGLLDRRYVERIETGGYKLSSERQRKGLSIAYGLTRSEIDAFIENQITIDAAIAIAKGKTVEVPFRSSAAPQGARTPEELGERMATAIALRQSELAAFPNLEFCLEYHRRNGKAWDAPVVAAARAGQFGDFDMATTGAWEQALDRLQSVMRHAALDASAPARAKTLKEKQ
jgi:transcriptional regulator with XRE-family HTH domain